MAAIPIITTHNNQGLENHADQKSMTISIKKVGVRRDGRKNPPIAATKEVLVKTEVSQRQRIADAVSGIGKARRATTANPQFRRSCAVQASGRSNLILTITKPNQGIIKRRAVNLVNTQNGQLKAASKVGRQRLSCGRKTRAPPVSGRSDFLQKNRAAKKENILRNIY